MMQLVDFHSHVLPGIDDGAGTMEEARQLLLSQYAQGIEMVVATPHCLKNTSISTFVERRDAALATVLEQIQEPIPHIVPAAEVAFYYGLSEQEELKRLCISGTNYILIEMPMEYWNDWTYEELHKICVRHNVRPIIAHLDRYINTTKDLNRLDKLLALGVLVQVNAEALFHFSTRRLVKALWQRKGFNLIGSDCHNMDKRPCELAKACTILQRKFGVDALNKILENSERVLQNRTVYR